jgi:hypothetical protein
MSPARIHAKNAVTDLRRAAAVTAELCDVILLGTDAQAAVALRALPSRIRTLRFRAQRTLTALESEGIS